MTTTAVGTADLDLRDFYPDGDVQPSDPEATTEAFHRAGRMLEKLGGGRVNVPPGRWLVKALSRSPSVAIVLPTAGSTLRGAGILATTIALAAGEDCHVVAVTAPGITIERLTVTGGLASQPPEVLAGDAVPARRSHGIAIRECPAFTLVRDVLVTDVVGYGIGCIIVRGGPKAEPDPFVHVRLHNVTLRDIGDDAIDFKLDVNVDEPRPDAPDPTIMGRLGPRGFLKNISISQHSRLSPNGTEDRTRGENGVDGRGQLHLQNIEVLGVRPGQWGKHGGSAINFRDETRPGKGVSSASHGHGGQWSTLQNYFVTRRPRTDLRNVEAEGLIVTPTLAPVVSATNGVEVLLDGGPRWIPPVVAVGRTLNGWRSNVMSMGIGASRVESGRTMAEVAPSLSRGDYAFIDFGAGFGASLDHYRYTFGGRGLGVEIEARKVDEARAKGRNVVEGSLFDVPSRPLVRYVTADNVLEHLADLEQVEDALRVAQGVASEFIYVRHPSFEDEDYLRSLGVSGTWVHRSGHRAHVRIVDFLSMATRLGIDRVEIIPVGLMVDTSDEEIVPLGTPKNDLTYDPAKHGPKPKITFDREVFYAFDILFHLARRPSVRLVHTGDPLTTRERPVLVREIGSRGWPRPTMASTRRRVITTGRRTVRRLPEPARDGMKRGVHKIRSLR